MSNHDQAIIWSIGGSDSGAGAGVQADGKTAQSFGVHCATVVTAVTAQNSHGVVALNAVDQTAFTSQIEALSTDFSPSVIKIGLLANIDQIIWLADFLADIKSVNSPPLVILDPVCVSSSGHKLTEQDTLGALKNRLLEWVDVLTVNWLEAAQLTGLSMTELEADVKAARKLQSMGVTSVIIKGGHSGERNCTDLVAAPEADYWLEQPRLAGGSSHGTGCCFATALACGLALAYPFKDAAVLANAYVFAGIQEAVTVGEGAKVTAHTGWPQNPKQFAVLRDMASFEAPTFQPVQVPVLPFASCDRLDLGLYPVVPSVEWVERLLQAGVKTIQLRIKDLSEPELRLAIEQANRLARHYKARLFINDHWQLAIECGCYGVHLGQEDLHTADLGAIQRAGLRLGVSTHGFMELLNGLRLRPSYLAIGAIFPTITKDMTGQIQGVDTLAKLLPLAAGYPVVAIGGINFSNLDSVLRTGVGSVAVVSAITEAQNPEAATQAFLHKLAYR